MNTEFGDPIPPTGGRPTFLTVLCVVLFIFCGWSAISNFLEASSPPDPEMVRDQIEQSLDMMSGLGGADSADQMESVKDGLMLVAESARPIAILKGIAALMAIAAAWMMWNLKRNGFHLYIVAGIIWAFAPMFITGAHLVTWVTAILYGFIVLLFTIMFAVNLRYMER